MSIDIDKLTQAELAELNNPIVERLRFLRHLLAHAERLCVRIVARVEFPPGAPPPVVGMLTRYNKKTVTVITDTGERWNVDPHLLRRVGDARASNRPDPKVLRLPGA